MPVSKREKLKIMNILDILLKEYERRDYEDILEIAEAISANHEDVMRQLEWALTHPKEYFTKNAQRFHEREIDYENEEAEDEIDLDDLFFLAMVDELQEYGYLYEVDWKCSLEDFLWSLEQLKNYTMISHILPSLNLDENFNVDMWIEKINDALDGKAYICYVDIDSDSFPLIIASPETYRLIGENDS